LLTCVGGEYAPYLIRYIKNISLYDVTVVGVDQNPDAVGRPFCDHFSRVCAGEDSSYPEEIERLVSSFDVDLIIPTSDEESLSLARSRNIIEKNGAKVACADSTVLEIISDKTATYRVLESNGFHLPFWTEVTTTNELITATENLYREKGAAVVKPTKGRGGRGVNVISTQATGKRQILFERELHLSLDHFLKNIKEVPRNDFPLLVMEKLQEPVFDIDLLAWRGETKRILTRRRVVSTSPNSGHLIVGPQVLTELGKQLASLFNLSWLYDIDVMYSNEGKACVLEINPRQSGSVAVSVAAGVPFIDDLIALANGDPIANYQDDGPIVGKTVIPFKNLEVFYPE
jgi:carbamoylphosphate synthase large subunit